MYRVTFDELDPTGQLAEPVASDGLCLFQRGESVPIWVVDGGDGIFGPGDWFEFVGEQLAGEQRHYHEYSRWNVYQLKLDRSFSHRINPRAPLNPQEVSSAGGESVSLRAKQHLEIDRLLVRIGGFEFDPASPPELWYWAKLSHIDSEASKITLDLSDLDPAASTHVNLRLRFFGLSHSDQVNPAENPDHRVDVALDGKPLASAEWSGRKGHLLTLPAIEASAWVAGRNELSVRVPRRQGGRSGTIVDVVMLDWIEIDYPRTELVEKPQARLRLADAAPGDRVRLRAPHARRLVAYGDRGSRFATPGTGGEAAAGELQFEAIEGETAYHVVVDGSFRSPAGIERDQPSQLAAQGQFADYLMIAHRSLLHAVAPLAELHRRRGLRVALIDVQDIYDEFNHGIVHPRAIRDFLRHAYRRWLKPAPRFVLLVGDASWDTKNATVDDANYANWTTFQLLQGGDRFGVKDSEAYTDDAASNRRNLIPTWSFPALQGHSASDNWFVALNEDDPWPVMAIGRLPVTEPEEVRAIVDKTLRYVEQPQVGPWRRSSLWITNETRGFQQISDQLAVRAAERGLGLLKVYPLADEASNAAHQARLRQAFDDGQYLVHFFGHGGRFIWRTGPPDLEQNHDLFTLDDLEQLAPNDRLAIVLSMTCFSAPFDHPNADSIGEKFLRLPGRGAVGVLGASWRTKPSDEFSRVLVDELTQPGTLGEAVLRAKQRIRDPSQVEPYNLLGDPALPLAVPRLQLKLTPNSKQRSGFEVEIEVGAPDFRGQAQIDWLSATGDTLDSQATPVHQPRFTMRFAGRPEALDEVRAVRVYVWDPVTRLDGLGRLEIEPSDRANRPKTTVTGPASY
ncbi:MAG: C25 family cysteine peptidase [Acidobacteriota bacterium]